MVKFRTPYCADDYYDAEINDSDSLFEYFESLSIDDLLRNYLNGDRSKINKNFTFDGDDNVKILNDNIFEVPIIDDRDFDPSDIPPSSTFRDISDSLSVIQKSDSDKESFRDGDKVESVDESTEEISK